MRTVLPFLLTVSTLFLLAACGGSEDKENYTDRMAEEHKGDSPIANGSAIYSQQQPVDTMTVNYAETDSGAISGFFAKPQNESDDLPGIIVIHEWWGLNDNIRMMTKRLAGLGYKALAVDLYNGKVADSPESAKKYMQVAQNNPDGAVANLKEAYSYLSDEQNAKKIGVIGWCFGGGWSLQTALAMPDKIDATVIYYGQLVTEMDQLRSLGMPILAFFGGKDKSISIETISTFKSNLKMLDKKAQIYVYDDANHAFANPSGTRYNKQAAQDAWNKTKAFLQKNLK